MTIRIDGTNTAANPGITGTDTDTGLQFGTDEVNIVTGGSTRATVDSSGRLLVGTTTGTESVHVNGAIASVGTSSSFSGGAKRAFFDYNGGANRARIGVTSGANNAAQALSFHTSPSGSAPGSVERIRITSDGTLQLRNSTGIDFSQIQTNATGMTSELLDSYEEGNWTPSISGATLSGEAGTYTRVGRFVHAHFYCPVSSHNNDTTVVVISGLPFTGSERSVGASIIVRNGIDHTIQLLATYNGSSFTSIKFAKTVNDGNSNNLLLNDCNTNFHLAGAIQYHVQ